MAGAKRKIQAEFEGKSGEKLHPDRLKKALVEVRAELQDLAASLKGIVSQRLVRSKRGGRIPAVEILLNNGQMTGLIEAGDVVEIKEAMERSLAPGSQSFEQSLYSLLQKDLITRDDALAAADSKKNLMWLINNAGKPQGMQAPPPRKEHEPSSFSEFTLNI